MRAIDLITGEPPAARAMASLRVHGACARRWLAALFVVSLSVGLAGCHQDRATTILGNPKHGVALIKQNGCGTCHVIPGIEGADGLVGPPLTMMARRIYIAGVRRNTPDNMVAWLQNPQAVVPGNAMPNMALSRRDALDIAAYLYSLH